MDNVYDMSLHSNFLSSGIDLTSIKKKINKILFSFYDLYSQKYHQQQRTSAEKKHELSRIFIAFDRQ